LAKSCSLWVGLWVGLEVDESWRAIATAGASCQNQTRRPR
jgi:hypothetical protein